MKIRKAYRGLTVEARSYELRSGGYSAEFSIEDHDGAGVTETQFHLTETFPAEQAALDSAFRAAAGKIDTGFRPSIS